MHLLATPEQLELAHKLGLQQFILPSMSSHEVSQIISKEIQSKKEKVSRDTLKVFLDRGLHCGCEISQKVDWQEDLRWGLVYKIDKKKGIVSIFVNDRHTAQIDAKDILERDFEKDPKVFYVPRPIQRDIIRGKYGIEIKRALQSKIMPITRIHACFLPVRFAKGLGIEVL